MMGDVTVDGRDRRVAPGSEGVSPSCVRNDGEGETPSFPGGSRENRAPNVTPPTSELRPWLRPAPSAAVQRPSGSAQRRMRWPSPGRR
jgi:hypothetical protein